MSTITRTSYLDSIARNTANERTIQAKQQQRQIFACFNSFYEYLQYLYMQFLLVTTLYVMEPWERILMITILLLIISLVTYSALIYIPFHIHHVLQSTIFSHSVMDLT